MAGASPGGGSTHAQYGSGKQASGPPPGNVRWGRAAWAIAVALLSWGAPPRSGAVVSEAPGGFVEVAVGLGEDGFSAVAADGRDPSRFWAASGARVIESRDGGRTWRDLVRLPGTGANPPGTAGSDGAEGRAREPLAAGLDDETPEEEFPGAGGPASTEGPGEAAGEPVAEARRIAGLRGGPMDGLWIAATDGVYRYADPADATTGEPGVPGAGGKLERVALPGGASAFAVAPHPLRPGSAWVATSAGLFRIDEGQLRRVAGEVGRAAVRDVDAAVVEGEVAVAVATADGLFVSRGDGNVFLGPLTIGPAGGAAAAVRFAGDGAVLAVAAEGILARIGPGGDHEVRWVSGLGRGIRRLSLAGGFAWFATAEGPFAWELPEEWTAARGEAAADGAVAVFGGLPAAGVNDVVAVAAGGGREGTTGDPRRGTEPSGPAYRLLVATDRGLFLSAPDLEGAGDLSGGGEGVATFGAPGVAVLASRAEAHLGLAALGAHGRIAFAPFLPRVDVGWTEVPADRGTRDTWAVVARWDLARILGAQVAAASATERRLHRARRSLGLRIERAVRARNRLVAARAAATPIDAALAALNVDEQTARIAGLTGVEFPFAERSAASAATRAGGPGDSGLPESLGRRER
jgi:hypothetical protein